MAKKHKNLENILIQWDGDLSHPQAGDANQSIPANVDLGTWSGNPTTGYVPCWADENGEISQERVDACVIEDMYFEDFDIANTGQIDSNDVVSWVGNGRGDIATYLTPMITALTFPPKGRVPNYTWGDVSFVIEIADGLGTGSRRAREARLNKFDDEKKKKLIHLICRVKGIKVYDEKKEAGDIQIKLEDAELVIERVLGKMRVENANVL